MITKIAAIFILLAAFAAQAVAQDSIGKEIKNRDIEWSDFAGTVDPASRFDAATNWAITYKYSAPVTRGDKVYIKATTFIFLRSNSWFNPNKQSERLLDHERGHFRIGRICAREIVLAIDSTAFDPNNYRKEIESVYLAVLGKYQEIEKQYDRETNHYKDPDQQARWNKKLDELLRK